MPATPTDRIDGLTTSVAVKAPCVAKTTANITLSGLQTVGGVDLASGDRVLVKDQTDTTTNGIYVVSTSTWSRARDFDGTRDAVPGTLVVVVSTGNDLLYKTVCADDPVNFGTSQITFSLAAFGDASTVSFTQTGTGAVARTVSSRLQEIKSAKDFGATGNGVTNDTAALQAALTAAAGGVLYIPDGNYITTALSPSANTTILMSDGARLLGRTSSNNCIFSFSNTVLGTSNLATGLAGGTTCVVATGATFSVNDRVIISAGTFTGSGVEEGPIEFNTITGISGNTLTLSSPLQYSYSAFGIPGASPRVKRLGPQATAVRNIRITGGRLSGESGFSGLCFNFACVENITIENVRIEDDPAASYVCFGTGIATGHQVSRLIFRNNVIRGNATGGTAGSNVGLNVATVTESIIEGNIFNASNENATNIKQFNHLILEVACRDNIIAHNVFGPIATVNSAAIEFTFYSFGNRIIGNKIWGLDSDIAAGTVTLGVRTFANGSDATFPGNIIVGNEFANIMVPIGDGQNATVVTGNQAWNQTLSAAAIGIMVANDAVNTSLVGNAFRNMTYNVRTNSGTEGGVILDTVSTAPAHGGIGSIFSRHGSTTPGQAFYTAQPTTAGGVAYYPLNQIPNVTFASIGTPGNGTLLYVTDGTTGSNPLSSGGSGTLAIRVQNTWRALPHST